MAATEIGIRLTLDGGKVVSAAINDLNENLTGMGRAAKSASSGFESLQTAMAGIVTVGGAMQLLKVADSVTQLQTALKLSSNSANEAKAAFEGVFAIAQRTRVSFTELGNTYAAIARSGNELGISQQRLLKVTESISAAMTIGGGTAASMQAALVQLGQGLSSGTLRGEELNSVMEQTPRLAKAIAEGMGVTIGQLRSLGEQGKLTGEAVISALEKSGPQLMKEIDSATLTVSQSLTVLQNSFSKFIGEVDAASKTTETVAGAIKGLSGMLDTLGAAAKNNQGVTAFLTGLGEGAVGVGLLTGAVYGLITAIQLLGKSHPILLAITGVGAAGVALDRYYTQQAGTVEGLKNTIKEAEQAKAALDRLKASMAGDPKQKDFLAAQTTSVANLVKKAEEAQKALDKLNGSSGDRKLTAREIDNAIDARTFSGVKELDAVRKTAKLRTDIIKEYQDKEKDLRQAFEKQEASTWGEQLTKLQTEKNDRLKKLNAERIKDLKAYDDALAKPGKEAGKQAQEAAKERLSAVVSGLKLERQAAEDIGKEKLRDLESLHKQGLESELEYITQKSQIAQDANIDQQAVLELELEAVQRSGIAKEQRVAKETKLISELQKLSAEYQTIKQNEVNAIAEMDNRLDQAADTQNKKLTESVDTYIAELQRKQAADQAAAAARAAMAGQPAEIIAGMQAEMAVHAQAQKTIDDLTKTYLKAAKAASDYAQDMADVQDLLKLSPQEQQQIDRTYARLVKTLQTAGTELGRVGDATNAAGIAAKVNATGESLKQQTDKLAQDINTKLVDGIMSAGKDGGAGLVKAIEDMLVIKPFKIVLEATLAPISNAIAQGIMGTSIAGSAAGASPVASALNTASLAVSAFGKSALSAAVDVASGGASFMGAMSTAGKMVGAGQYAAGFGQAVGTIAPYALAAAAAASAVEALSTIKVSPAGTFLYGGSGYADTESGFKWGGRRDFMQEGYHRGSNKNSEWFAPDPAIAEYMTATGKAITESVKGWASAIGLSADTVDNYKGQIEVSLDGLSDGASVKAAIDKAFSGMADSMVSATIGNQLTYLAKSGETSSATLSRLATNLTSVNGIFEKLGGTTLDASLSSATLATSIVDAAGGLDNLGKLTGAMYDAIATPAQKAADSAAQLDKSFAALGVSTPKTVSSLADMAKAQDLSTDSGRKTAVALLGLLPAFEQVQASAESTRQAMLKDAGVNNGDIASVVKKGLIDGTLKNAGGEISDVVMAGIQNALYGRMADAITNSFTNEMLAPLFQAMQDGATLPEALAKVDFSQVKSKFQQTVDDISAVFNNAQVTSGISSLRNSIQELFSSASYSIPKAVATGNTVVAVQGSFAVGTNYVPQDMVAQIHRGEAIIPAAFNPWNPLTGSTVADEANGYTTAYDTYRYNNPAMAQFNDAQIGYWLANQTSATATANVGYYQDGLIADSRSASSSNAGAGATDYTSLESDAVTTYISALKAVGETYTANTLALQNATKGFDDLHVAMYREVEAGKSLVSMRETLAQSAKDYASSEVELLKARGDNAAAAAKQREIDLADTLAQKSAAQARLQESGLSELEQSYQAGIVATADQIVQQYDLAQARQAEIAVLNERKGLQEQLNELTDTSAQALARQRDALDESNRALFDQVQAAKAVKDATGWQDRIAVLGATDESKASVQRAIDLRNDLANATNDTTKDLIRKYYDQLDAKDALAQAQEVIKTKTAADITLLRAQGREQEALALQRTLDIQGMSDAKIAAYDYAKALEHQAAVLNERKGLETQLLQAQGDTLTLRARERAALDESNRALFDQVQATKVAQANQGWNDKIRVLSDPTAQRKIDQERDLASATDDTTKALINQYYAQLNLKEATAKAVDDALASVQRSISAEKERISNAAEAQKNALQDQIDYNTKAQAYNKGSRLDDAKKIASDLGSIFDAIENGVKALRDQIAPEMSLTQARAYIDMSLSLARAGSMPSDYDKLKEAISQVTRDTPQQYASLVDFQRSQAVQAGKLEELGALAGKQKTLAEQTVDGIEEVNYNLQLQISALDDQSTAQLKALDAQLQAAEDAVSVARGIDVSVKSVGDAVNNLSAAISNMKAAATQSGLSSAGGSYVQSGSSLAFNEWVKGTPYTNDLGANIVNNTDRGIQGYFQELFGRGVDQAGLSYWESQAATMDSSQLAVAIAAGGAANGESLTTTARELLDKFNIPAFAVGTNYVPRDTLAYLHQGEAVVPKAYNPAASFGESTATERLIADLKKEVVELRSQMAEMNYQSRRTANAVNGNPEAPMLVESV